MQDKDFILKVMGYEDEILELIELQMRNDDNSLTQSDLQGALMAIVMRIMNERKVVVDHVVYNKNLVKIGGAMSEMDENSPSAFQVFIDKMARMGAVKIK